MDPQHCFVAMNNEIENGVYLQETEPEQGGGEH
jgi:hypothetical protein